MRINHKENITLLALVSLVILSGYALVLPNAIAGTDAVDEITITVPPSCSLSSTGGDSHTAEILNGQTNSSVGESTIKAYCNDNNGFSIYAIGYTDNELGKTVLTSSTLGSTHDILTGTNTTGNSSWAMKLSTITSPEPTYPLIIAGSEADTDKEQGDPDYTSFQEIPDDYALVAKRTSSTDTGENAEGATLKTTYQVHISNTQSAGTYTGQVKYTMVHPYNGAAPIMPPTPQSSCSTSPMISTIASGVTYMQDINSANKTVVLSALTDNATYQIKDNRDEQVYCVGKLAGDKLWLLDNLALDLTNSTVLNGLTESNTNASNTTLGYLKNGGGTTSDKYAITGVVNWTDSPSYASGYSYSDPLVNLVYKDTVTSNATDQAGDYKIGGYYNYCAASAGSYCYGNGTNEGTSTGNTTEDICPKGWRMPTGASAGEYNTLYTNSNYNTYANYRAALHLPLSGYVYSGSVGGQGSYGGWWSSTRRNSNYMYSLYANTSIIDLTYYSYRYSGISVRCTLAD